MRFLLILCLPVLLIAALILFALRPVDSPKPRATPAAQSRSIDDAAFRGTASRGAPIAHEWVDDDELPAESPPASK